MENISREKVKFLRSLKQKKYRIINEKFIIEGSKSVDEAIVTFPEFILTTDKTIKTYPAIKYLYCSQKEMDQISIFSNSTKVIALISCHFQRKILTGKRKLLIDQIQDPGNFGTIIRTCDWFGINHIICNDNTVDVYNSKVIQSTMGSIFRVKIDYINLTDFLQNNKLNIVAAHLDGLSTGDINWSDVDGILIGNEGKGISQHLLSQIKCHVCIPKVGEAESLNASVATGVLLSKWSS